MTQKAANVIPDNALADCVAVIGRVGAGKSYTARGLAERVLDNGERLCVIDPTGVWWGLRLGPDGKKAGYPVVVFGGDYGDVEIGEHSAAPLAELVAGRNLPCVVDVSEFTIAARTRFLTAFLETLYSKNPRTPLTLVVDEADMVAPQRIQPDQTVMFSRLEQIVRRGRVRGFRPWLITQRPAELNKSVLSQAATLIALKLTAPQDRKAVEEWVMGHADKEQGREVLGSLAGLSKGQGWVWCPGSDILEQVGFPKIKTYDSMRTPEVGSSHPAPAKLSELDLTTLQESLKEVEAEIAANDPRKLKARIAELEREARQKAPLAAPTVDRAAVEAARQDGYVRGQANALRVLRALSSDADQAMTAINRLQTSLASASSMAPAPPPARPAPRPSAPTPCQAGVGKGSGDESVGQGGLRRILIALAQCPDGLTNRQVGVRAALSSKSGTFSTYLSKARTNGWVEGSGVIRITTAGIEALGSYEPLPTGQDLLAHWLSELGDSGAARLLRVVADAYPQPLTNVEAGERANLAHTSGTFSTYLSRLRTLELVTGRGEIRASDDLFV